MASKVSGIIEKIQSNGSSGTSYAIASTAYGYCQTAANQSAKIVDMTGFTLYEGVTIHIKFQYNNTASNPTLNVNDTGAKPIVQYGTTAISTGDATTGWYAGAVVSFTYDGTSWVRDQGFNTNSTYSYMRPYENTGKGSYSTQGANPAKTAAAGWKFQLSAGKYFMYTHYYDNTAQSALTLNIGSTGAKPIYINGAASSSSNYTLPGGQYLVYYDGTNYYFRTDGKMTGDITGDAATVNGHTVGKDVPSNAVFTDTKSFTITANATDGYWDLTGTNGTNAVTYALAPYSSKQSGASFYTGTTNPDGTTRLNYNGYLYASKLYSNGTEVSVSGHNHDSSYVKKTGDLMSGKLWISSTSESLNTLTSTSEPRATGTLLEVRHATNSSSDIEWPVSIKNVFNQEATTPEWSTGIKLALGGGTETTKWVGIRAVNASAYANVTVMDFYANETRAMRMADTWLAPETNEGMTLGTSSRVWKELYVKDIKPSRSIYFGPITTGTSKAVLVYDANNTKHGIWYYNDNKDKLIISASGNADSLTDADFIVEQGGILYNKGYRIPHTGNTTGTVGSTKKPVYLDGGQIKEISYTIEKSVPSNAVFTDHYAWTDITNKPATATRWPAWSEVTGKPTSFTPATHTHNYLPFSYTAVDYTSTSTTMGVYPHSGVTHPVTGETEYGGLIQFGSSSATNSYYSAQLLVSSVSGATSPVHAYIRRMTSTPGWSGWSTLLDDKNYTSYAWARPSSITSDQVLISSGTDGSTTLRAILNNTTASALGWNNAGNTHANNLRLIDVNTLAYWNGAYSGTSSNLTYYKGGAFGTMAKETATDYAKLASPTFTGTPKAPTAANGTSTTQIATTEFVNNTLAYANAMTFKGTLGTDGTATALPASHNAGDTYRVITADTWAGKYCEVGTLIICVKDGTAAADADWTSVETNEDGAVIGTTPTSSTDNAIVRWDGSSGRIIQNSSTVLQDDGTIKFAQVTSTSYPANSAGLSWSGDNDGASIYYSQRASNSGHLVLQTTDDNNETIIFRHTKKADSNNYDGVIINPYAATIYPAVNAQGSVGTSSQRWATLYAATSIFVGGSNFTAYNTNNQPGVYIGPEIVSISQQTGAGARGFWLIGNGQKDYARLYINALGTASTAESSSGANDGTQGAVGDVILILGNSTARGAKNTTNGLGNARGRLRLHGTTANYIDLYTQDQTTNGRAMFLPNSDHVDPILVPSYDLSGTQDLNTKYNAGIYCIEGGSVTNYPSGSTAYANLLVLPYRRPQGNTKPDFALQIYGHSANRLWFRGSDSSNWRAWQELVHVAANTGAGSTNTPVYITTDGTVTAVSKYLATHVAGGSEEIQIKYSTTIDYWWGVSTANENHGLYDNKVKKWILSAGAANTWTFDGDVTGNADTATIATYIQGIDQGTGNINIANTITSLGEGKIRYDYRIGKDSTGLFAHSTESNTNAILTFSTASGTNYIHQLGFSTNEHLYHRAFISTAQTNDKVWNEILDSSNYTTYAVAKTAGVTAVTWDATNKKLTRTINGTAADVMTAAQMSTALGLGTMASETATNYLKWQTTSSASTALYNFGVYVAQNTAAGTGPNGSNYYNLINIPYRKASGNSKLDWGWQLGNTTSNDNRLYYRTTGDNTAGDWQTIAHATTSSNNTGSARQPVYMASTGTITTANYTVAHFGSAGKSNMNDIGRLHASTGMTNLADPGNNNDNPMNGSTKSTGWHLYWDTNYTDDPNGSNAWVAQIVNRAGTSHWWVRSRSGSTITNGTAWASNWRHLVTSTEAAVGDSTTPVYIDANGEVQSCTSYANASVNYATSAGSASSATTAAYSAYLKIVASNEIRFDVNTKPSSAVDLYIGYAWSDGSKDAKINGYRFENGNSNLAKVYASEFVGSLNGNASTASKITNLTTTDMASDTTTWRRVWISYNDNVTGRPAYKGTIAFQTSTNTLKSGKYLVGDHVTLEYSTTDDSLDFIFI